jgi:hypothetical protein
LDLSGFELRFSFRAIVEGRLSNTEGSRGLGVGESSELGNDAASKVISLCLVERGRSEDCDLANHARSIELLRARS